MTTETNGPVSEAIAIADAHLNNVCMPNYTDAREALAGLLELAELLAYNCADRVDVTNDERLARARAVLGS